MREGAIYLVEKANRGYVLRMAKHLAIIIKQLSSRNDDAGTTKLINLYPGSTSIRTAMWWSNTPHHSTALGGNTLGAQACRAWQGWRVITWPPTCTTILTSRTATPSCSIRSASSTWWRCLSSRPMWRDRDVVLQQLQHTYNVDRDGAKEMFNQAMNGRPGWAKPSLRGLQAGMTNVCALALEHYEHFIMRGYSMTGARWQRVRRSSPTPRARWSACLASTWRRSGCMLRSSGSRRWALSSWSRPPSMTARG